MNSLLGQQQHRIANVLAAAEVQQRQAERAEDRLRQEAIELRGREGTGVARDQLVGAARGDAAEVGEVERDRRQQAHRCSWLRASDPWRTPRAQSRKVTAAGRRHRNTRDRALAESASSNGPADWHASPSRETA